MEIQYSLPNVTSTLQIIGCHIGETKPNWSYPWHHHYLFELLYCKEGIIKQTVGEEIFELTRGDWLLIKSGISHATENNSSYNYKFFNLHFDLDNPFIREQLCRKNYVLIKRDEAKRIDLYEHYNNLEKAIRNSNDEQTSKQDLAINQLTIQSLTLAIISIIIKYSETVEPLHKKVTYVDANPKNTTVFETELAHDIEMKLRNNPTIKINEMALELGISRGRCTDIFTKVYGQSPRQYVSRLVLNHAKHLLVHSTLTMEEIAEKLEFQSASHFSRQFRRWTGMSPSSFRPKYVREVKIQNQLIALRHEN